ncbi:uncharacterized protein LOC108138620 [Drosophila elegans]|uniref:uncharacterized protein LOC108138620 n=1 Tax=Drosophila elegans TaxID=30023 RepID=UPI0007E6B32D|nr:uncharacterized protein LOC108138620 [Drosophila elegans]
MTCRSDISRRLPAERACSCGSISDCSVEKPSYFEHQGMATVSESTQTVSTKDMATQTAIQPNSNGNQLDSRISRDASTQSQPRLQDAETQSIPFLSLDLKSSQSQTEIIVPEETKQDTVPNKPKYNDEKAQSFDSSLRKSFFKRPMIVVKRCLPLSTEFTNEMHQSTSDTVLVTSHKEDKQTQYEKPLDAKSSEPLNSTKILDRVVELETKLRKQEQSLKDLQGSMNSWKAQEGNPADCSLIFKAQAKDCESPKKPANRYQPTQKNDEDDCEYSDFSKEFIKICLKPEGTDQIRSRNDTQKPIAKQCTCRNDANSRKVIGKPSASQRCKDNRKAISTQCDLNDNHYKANCRNNTKKPFPTQSLEDTDNFLQQFNRVFLKPKNEESICDDSRKISEENKTQRSPYSVNPTNQNLKQKEVDNLLDGFVKLAAKAENETPRTRRVSSTSCLNTNKSPQQSQSEQTVEKEVYQSLIEQFIQLFTKSKKCGNEQDEKTNAFGGLLVELVKYFIKPKDLESSPCKEEDGNKNIPITERKSVSVNEQKTQCNCSKAKRNFNSTSTQSDLKMTDMHEDLRRRDERPGSLARKSTISEIYASNASFRETKPTDPTPCRCQFCGDGNLPVLDSLLHELFYLIGPRSFNDVVLTILRHPDNIYHINIREMASGTVLGCLLANGRAINEAIALGLFEDIHTFCELDKHREHDPRDCPLGISPDVLCPRERGGDIHPDREASKIRAIEFSTRVLGVPAGQAGRFFSLTNALKLAKKPSDQSVGCSELSMVSLHWRGSPGQGVPIGQGAVTGSHLLSMRSCDRFSLADFSEPGKTSSLFLRIVSGQDQEAQDDQSKIVRH